MRHQFAGFLIFPYRVIPFQNTQISGKCNPPSQILMKLCQRVEISTENYHVNFQSEIHIRFPSTGIRSWPYSWTKLCLKSNKLFDFLQFTVRGCLFYIQSLNLAMWCLRMWKIHKCHRKCNLMSISNHKLAYYNPTFYSYIKFGSVSWKTPNFFRKNKSILWN